MERGNCRDCGRERRLRRSRETGRWTCQACGSTDVAGPSWGLAAKVGAGVLAGLLAFCVLVCGGAFWAVNSVGGGHSPPPTEKRGKDDATGGRAR